MHTSVGVKNTFVHAVSTEEADSAAKGLLRTSSCPSLVASPATSQEYADSENPAVSQLANLGTWADLDTDSEEEHLPACPPSVGLSSFGFMDAVNLAFKGGEKAPVPQESVSVQTSEEVRTPLSRNASAFVPSIRLNGKASAFCPRSSQMVSDSSGFPVHGTQWWETNEPHKNTTVILGRLSRGVTRAGLIQTLNDEGFAGLYDFIYMPMDFKNKVSMGISFVNLMDGEQAQHLIEKFDGRPFGFGSESTKVCTAALSSTQGLAANIARYQNSPVMGNEVPECFKPALFVGKQQAPFPEPTKKLRPVQPRMNPQ